MKIKVTGGYIERGEPWTVNGTYEQRYRTIAFNEHTNETENFWTENAARHALHVVDETVMSERFRLSCSDKVDGPPGSGKTVAIDIIVKALSEKFDVILSDSKSENEIWMRLESKERKIAFKNIADNLGDKFIVEYILNAENQSCLLIRMKE